MADQPSRPDRHLDAGGSREVVYCHQCAHEWYQDEHGLICPHCEGEITEIVSPESDPRPGQDAPITPSDLPSLRNHNPWAADSDVSDPEEADIEEHVTHGPGGSIFISQTIRSHGHSRPRGARPPRRPVRGDPDDVMNDFQSMLGNLMGRDYQPGITGRSGRDDLFPPPIGFRMGGNGMGGPNVIGGRFTYTTGRLQPRNVHEPQAPPDIATLIGNILGTIGPPVEPADQARGGMPQGLQGLFASLLNPANARAGDAVYTQEALDQIISTLMEQHPTSNAPGPASPAAIAGLPKKNLDEKLLGPEGKGECSVCMDDVTIGTEVVMLPCSHWFHEACAAAWLGEHNTCPICRKGIEGDASASPSPPSPAGADPAPRRLSLRSRVRNPDNAARRSEARLDSIRNTGRLSPTGEAGPTRYQIVGDGSRDMEFSRQIPGSFSSPRRRDSEMSENQRDGRRGNTSGSDRSRDSRRSSGSTSGGGNNGGTGPISWLRDRFGGSNNDRRRD